MHYIKYMGDAEKTQYLLFRQKHIADPIFLEIVNAARQDHWEVARPLFDAGITNAAITERIDYDSGLSVREFHTFTLLLQGEMEIDIDQAHCTIGPGQLVYVPPGTSFRRCGKGATWWIFISILDLPQWSLLKKRGSFVRNYEYAPLMYSLLRTILDAKASRGPNAIVLARQNARALLGLLKHEMAGVESPGLRHRFNLQQLIDDIARRPEHGWTVPEMAARLHISTSLLTKLFRREFNQAPMEVVIYHRIQKAELLLQRTGDTIESIANAVGYKSPFSFSRLFKQHTGLSPGRYRDDCQKNKALDGMGAS